MQKYWPQLEAYIEQAEALAPEVSDKPVAWHLDHSLRVIIAILENIRQSDPAQYTSSLSWSAWYVLLTGHIPRGKGRAPKGVVSKAPIDKAQLREMLQKAKDLYPSLKEAKPKQYFEHPYFGHLNKKRTGRFLGIHSHHHLKIIRDILKKVPKE